MRRVGLLLILLVFAAWPLVAQVPQPFPRPPQTPGRPAPSPTAPAPPAQPAPAAIASASTPDAAPTEALLGFPIYPAAQFITSYDAGRGQRYYLFGSELSFAVLVKYYQGVLKNRGTLVFEAPAVHIFEIGRFREEMMAYPPGVTIKDYTWNGSAGYLNPKKDGKPARFPTIIQIVPAPAVGK